MSHPIYNAMIFIADDSDFTFEKALTVLQGKKIGSTSVLTAANRVALRFGEWSLFVALEEGHDVRVESIELASMLDNRDVAARIDGCSRRLTVWSVVPDLHMDHFNDYVIVVEVLESSFIGMVSCNPQTILRI